MSSLQFSNQPLSINQGGTGLMGTGQQSIVIKLGVDVGNGFVKTNGRRFPSAAKLHNMGKAGKRAEGHHQVALNGELWEVGNGSKFIRNRRWATEQYKVCLLTAIAMEAKHRGINANNIIADVCVGLPQDLHKKEDVVADLRETVLSWGKCNVQVDNDIEGGINANYDITIRKCLVFCEGAICLLTGDMSKTLTVDIGAGTLNAVLWENGAILAEETTKTGAQSVFTLIKDQMATKYGTTLEQHEIEKIIMSGQYSTYLNNSQTPTDLSADFHRWIGLAVDDMFNKMSENKNFNYDTIQKIQFLGGGSTFTFSYWQDIFEEKAVLIDNAQYINSQVYEAVINHA